jgi:TRAP-type C4-dicarboxylate transport system substrate-binding protein
MARKTPDDSPELMQRRRFLEVMRNYGVTTAAVAAGGGALLSSDAIAQTAKEEAERQKAAKFTMIVATPYVLGASRSYPIMQLDFKENLQNSTNGKIYVKLAPGGQLGTAAPLVQKVQNGTIQVAQHSLSNFAPFAPVVDLVNLPYFCGANQKFVNLVTSDVWKKDVTPKVEQRGFKPLWYVVIDPRTTALRKGVRGPAKTPADLKGIKFRVPGSKMLEQYYRMVGANPTPIAWGETATAIKQGVADALDPAVGALYVFGFKDILSWVTFSHAVPDSQAYSCNLEWFNGLPSDVKEGVEHASEITFQQNLAKVPAARAYAMAEMRKANVQFHSLTDDELKQWVEAAGYQRSEWDGFKKSLAGSMQTFAKFEEATKTQSKYYVNDA